MKPVFATLQHSANLALLGSFTSPFPFNSSSYFQVWIPAAATHCPFDHSCSSTDLHNWSQPHINPPALPFSPGASWGGWKAPSCCWQCGPHLSIPEHGGGQWVPTSCWPREAGCFSLCFMDLLQWALVQLEGNCIYLHYGGMQTSGLKELVSQCTPSARFFQSQHCMGSWMPEHPTNPSILAFQDPSRGRHNDTHM